MVNAHSLSYLRSVWTMLLKYINFWSILMCSDDYCRSLSTEIVYSVLKLNYMLGQFRFECQQFLDPCFPELSNITWPLENEPFKESWVWHISNNYPSLKKYPMGFFNQYRKYWKYVKMLQIVMKKCRMRIPKMDEHCSQRKALLSLSKCGDGLLFVYSCIFRSYSPKSCEL